MKKLITTLLMTVVCIAAQAETTPATRLYIEHGQDMSREAEGAPYQPLILQIADDAVLDALADLDVIIYNRRGHLLITSVPKATLSEVLALEGIENAAASGDLSGCLDRAREFTNTDAVITGVELPQTYDGSGVVVGISDIGFDAHHIAFKDCLRALYHYDAAWGISRSATTAAEIADWTTDNAENYHATHVAGILGGGYKGNPYYGVATGADMVVTTSGLTDVGILAGVEDIISYAKALDKPAVINLSLANFLGPHDGTDLFCRYLSECAKDAVICLSAGNNGNDNNVYGCQDLSEKAPIGRIGLNSMLTYNGYDVYGLTDFWSIDDTPFDFRVEVFDLDNQKVVYATPWLDCSQPGASMRVDAGLFPEWGEYMQGVVLVESGVSNLNGRFNLSALYDTHTIIDSEKGPWSKYYTTLAYRRIDECDTHVDIFPDATYSYIGYADIRDVHIGSQGSISDMATADGVITVGMAVSRSKAPMWPEGEYEWPYEAGTISKYSSYSQTPTIAPLPDFSAPGYQVVAPMSEPFRLNNPEEIPSACAEVDGTAYYWFPMCGTSMASPYAAGVIALWLQADPTLTPQEIKEIAIATAQRHYVDIDNPRWGAGCIDAYAGIKRVLSGIHDVNSPAQPLIRITPEHRLEVMLPGGGSGVVRVFTLSGACVSADSRLQPGVYLVAVEGYKPQKVVISPSAP